MPIEVAGSGFIPGFTEQLVGMSAGETRTIQVQFPEGYGSEELAGKPAEFEITAKALKKPSIPVLDDALAQGFGLADAAALTTEVRAQLQRDLDKLARIRVKRQLLDALAANASFTVPEGMVEAEFGQIWGRVEEDRKAGRLDPEDLGKDEDTLKAEYRGIAERRIRLGLLLSEIGRTNGIQVGQEELMRALREQASRYPGQEQQVFEMFRKNPDALESLRAPIFEEKVVDFLLELAKVTERKVAPAELAEQPAAA
jgi:trigger factor